MTTDLNQRFQIAEVFEDDGCVEDYEDYDALTRNMWYNRDPITLEDNQRLALAMRRKRDAEGLPLRDLSALLDIEQCNTRVDYTTPHMQDAVAKIRVWLGSATDAPN